LGYVTWLLFAGVLLLRAAAGWRGRRAAYGTIAGFGCAMLVLLFYLLRGKPSTAPVVAQVLSFLGVPS
jgi:ABC-type transport system involved in cytochrome c biogenesis permease subunit